MVRDYSKGFIYKLTCKDVNVKEIYVGSSTNMKVRKNCHKTRCNNINCIYYNLKVYQYIRENGGFDNWSMIWIKDYPCNSKRELEAEEDKIKIKLNATLNTRNAIIDKEQVKKKKKEWTIQNKEKIDKQQKQYRINNKEELKKKASIIITCECGSEIRKNHIARHRKSKKHQNLISSIN